MRVISCIVLLGISLSASALTVVECVDADGNSSFRDKCPPGMEVKSTKKLRTKPKPVEPSLEEIVASNPVVLFTAPQCDACTLVKTQLEDRNVPFAEKDASEDPEIQSELSELTGGPLTVPTISIGDTNFTGYNRNELHSALTNAGYPE